MQTKKNADERYYVLTVSVFLSHCTEVRARELAKEVERAIDTVRGVSSATVEEPEDITCDEEG